MDDHQERRALHAVAHGIATDEIESFVPRRMRSDRQPAPPPPAANISPSPRSIAFRRNATFVADGIQELQEELEQTTAQLNETRARLEQAQRALDSSQLDLNNTRVELDRERAQRVRLSTIIENIGGLVQDGLAPGG